MSEEEKVSADGKQTAGDANNHRNHRKRHGNHHNHGQGTPRKEGDQQNPSENRGNENRRPDNRNHENRNGENRNRGEQQQQKQSQKQQNAPQKQAQNPKNGNAGKNQDGNRDGNRENGKNRNRNGNRNGNGNGNGNGNNKPPRNGDVHTRHSAFTDPYGIPSPKDQQVLNDLRAKIVVRAADGSIPAEAKKESAPAVEATGLPQPTDGGQIDEEAVANLSNEVLFETPAVMRSGIPEEEETVEVIGVQFRRAGKIYDFDPGKEKFKQGDLVIVETARGPEFGEVGQGNKTVAKKSLFAPLRGVIRRATENDKKQNAENVQKEKEALEICRKKVENRGLEMKLVDVQMPFDRSLLLFYFTAENRVDFRELVRELASIFHTRIELRQIGIRDEAKMLGGLGACGRPLCCSSFLPDFVQVSIKMAKEQGLSLNSSKISGACGRLMCCLRYESDVYAEEIRKTPPVDSIVMTPDGEGKVISNNPLAGTVRVYLSEEQEKDSNVKLYAREEVTLIAKKENSEKKNEDSVKKSEKSEKN